ncbi:MAG: GNAT family N-acetyltransferase [Deltaproteobacteria bacterium]|nr:GNAT family N-acetyltransferase [Deltaproteobacteria bacterium]
MNMHMKEICFTEGEYTVKTLSLPGEMEAAFKLRHDVFAGELQWVPLSTDGLDKDAYDDFAVPIGIFDDDGVLIGHVRLIYSPYPFMIEKEFASLLPEGGMFGKTASMVESTRICIRKEARKDQHGAMGLSHLLYKALYHWSRLNGQSRMVTIVEQRYFLLLKRSRFPFELSGDFKPLGKGVMSGIIILDWGRFDAELSVKRPEFYEWFTGTWIKRQALNKAANAQIPIHTRSQPHAAY